MQMTTSRAGRDAIMAREGVRLTAYADSVGVLTIGCGHTGRACGPAVTSGMTVTRLEAEAMLAADLATFEEAVNHAVLVSLTQNQFDACVSLAFNIGSHGFTGSTVVHRLNAGDPAGAADAFLMWDRPPELKGRRIGERRQFLTPAMLVARMPAPAKAAPAPVVVAAPAQPLGFWARLIGRTRSG